MNLYAAAQWACSDHPARRQARCGSPVRTPSRRGPTTVREAPSTKIHWTTTASAVSLPASVSTPVTHPLLDENRTVAIWFNAETLRVSQSFHVFTWVSNPSMSRKPNAKAHLWRQIRFCIVQFGVFNLIALEPVFTSNSPRERVLFVRCAIGISVGVIDILDKPLRRSPSGDGQMLVNAIAYDRHQGRRDSLNLTNRTIRQIALKPRQKFGQVPPLEKQRTITPNNMPGAFESKFGLCTGAMELLASIPAFPNDVPMRPFGSINVTR